ncbi:hypothetical protein ABVT39_013861 [Epinephelus coioides]
MEEGDSSNEIWAEEYCMTDGSVDTRGIKNTFRVRKKLHRQRRRANNPERVSTESTSEENTPSSVADDGPHESPPGSRRADDEGPSAERTERGERAETEREQGEESSSSETDYRSNIWTRRPSPSTDPDKNGHENGHGTIYYADTTAGKAPQERLVQSMDSMWRSLYPKQQNPGLAYRERSTMSEDQPPFEPRLGITYSGNWSTTTDKDEDLEFVKAYQPGNKNVKQLRILLYGPIGAGKSSFINSVDTILQDRIAGRAPTDAISGSSCTKKYKTYKIKKDPESHYPFVFNDIMGFEQRTDSGVHVEDVKLALRGHVAEGYQFNPKSPLQEGRYYRSSPTLSDRVQVLVCVIPADQLSIMSDKVVKKMREVRLAASELDIPQLAILTKADIACPKVKQNLNNAYKSIYLKKQVEKVNTLLGIPLNSIFLVKNYEPEPNINDDMNALIMSALRQMITFGDDFLSDL